MQNTWLKLLDNLSKIKQPEALAGWLATTARYESLSQLRRSGRDQRIRTDDLPDSIVDDTVSLDAALLTDERDAALWKCFEQLSERCRELLRVLVATDRPNYADVSEALGMPIGSIGPTRMRCLATLHRLLTMSGYAFAPSSGAHDARGGTR